MKNIKHTNSASLEEASKLLRQNGKARAIAGGTDLLGILKGDIHPEYPELLINLKTIPDLDYIREEGGWLRIGALTKLHDIAKDHLIQEKYTALAEAATLVGTPQIRNMATLGGNLCQETRCWYYRHPENHFHCLRKGGDICGALVGENRYHSILGAMRMQTTPCSAHCPAGIDIPDYLESIRAGDLDKASHIIIKSNPFPAITGRVCPHYCQEGCNRQEFDEAVSIREVERYLGDHILDHSERFFQPPDIETGKNIAVIGSGPGGLAAAYFLQQAGHRVTVFERLEKPGGMLTYTIPAYRLPADIVERSIQCIRRMGVEIQCGVEVGDDKTFQKVLKDYDALYLATGAWKLPTIGLEGEDRTVHALDFLKDIREGQRQAPGNDVCVIGGGNVAVDVAISARRLGAESVTIICLEQTEEMPATEAELQDAIDEGVELLNGWGPTRVQTHEDSVVGLELVRCISVFDEVGRFAPQYDKKDTRQVTADAVILAVSQQAETGFMPDEIMEHGRVSIDPQTGKTGLKNVYAGGDAVQPANVIDAIAASKTAASSIHSDLTGESSERKSDERFHSFDLLSLELVQAATAPVRSIGARQIDLEDSSSLPQTLFEIEAKRCLNCGCVAVTPSDTGTALIALEASILTTMREIPADEFFACLEGSSSILEPGELVKEVRLPITENGSRSAYRKFRLRGSIDFPIVSAAVRLDISEDTITDSRVVLGAVAPIPVRASAAEEHLNGKKIAEIKLTIKSEDEKRNRLDLPCAQSADLALQGPIALQENEYKIQLTRAYVRRAICACLE
jgi:NADPH-dependent glutamate synthase beta subunit-like oxidoreductase/CO/xanthine dehydrogenase FAD-binding subunit